MGLNFDEYSSKRRSVKKMKIDLNSDEISVISTILNEVYDNMVYDKCDNVFIDNQNIIITLSSEEMDSLKTGKKKILY